MVQARWNVQVKPMREYSISLCIGISMKRRIMYDRVRVMHVQKGTK